MTQGLDIAAGAGEKLRSGIFEAWALPKWMGRKKRQQEVDKGSASKYYVGASPNAYVNAGGAAMLNMLIGNGNTTAGNANCYPNNGNGAIGMGDSNTATAAGQTDLQAATNKLRKAMDATFPSIAGQVCTWQVTFASGDLSGISILEVALFNSPTAATGTMFARTVVAWGTKGAVTWVVKYTITVP